MRSSTVGVVSLAAFTIMLSCASAMGADKIILKSGDVLEGKISAETDTEIRIEVPMNESGTICKTKIIPRADIESIQRRSTEELMQEEMEKDYRATQRYRLKQSNYTVAYYDKAITGVFSNFVARYPDSTYAKEVKDKIAKWKAEREIVASGKSKHKGRWITGQEAVLVGELSRVEEMLTEGEELLSKKSYTNAISLAESLDEESKGLVKSCRGSEYRGSARDLRVKIYDFWCLSLAGRKKQIQKEIGLNRRRIAAAQKKGEKAERKLRNYSGRSGEASRKKRERLIAMVRKTRDVWMGYKRREVELKGQLVKLESKLLRTQKAQEDIRN